ncbi:MFS transporter [Streptococcus intermedius]|uniref:MFS transporter n=1 Tax=Streptococcus intermedius TaxID=1338 RepID=UPI000F691E4B|nr:MFS transporter [Streptococcus intermedius]RSJ21045.1 Multidrug resistance protein 3 [Streptococcus intermedius]
MTKKQKRLSMVALLLANFIGGLDTTMINTALPQIIKDLNGVNQLGLLTSILLFFVALTTVLWGKLGEVVGNKKAFQLATMIFILASLLGGLSWNIWVRVFARGMMGLGIGGMVSIPYVIYAKLFPGSKERAIALGWVTAFYSVASILGPIVGGFIVDLLGWSWVFYSLIPFGVISLILLQLFYQERVEFHRPKVDYFGSSLLVLISGLLLYWISNLTSISLVVHMILGLVLVFACFLLWQWEKRVEDPILPISLLKNSSYITKNLLMVLIYAFTIGYSIYAPMWAQTILKTNATLAGGTQILSSIAVMLATRLAASLIAKWEFKKLINLGFLSITISALMMAFATEASSYLYVAGSGAFLGLGQGLVFPPAQVAFQEAVPKEQLNIATTFSLLMRTLGQSFMASVYGLVYASQAILNSGVSQSYQGLHLIFILALIAVLLGWVINQITWKL